MKTINDVVLSSSRLVDELSSRSARAEAKRIARKQLRAKERMAFSQVDALAELRDMRQDQAVKPPKLRLVSFRGRKVAMPYVPIEFAVDRDREITVINGRAVASVSVEFLKAA